jgi:hypothetical protein
MDITELLERAVEDVVPAERRPTDAVLRLAEDRRLSSRIRRVLVGLVGVAVVGGGAVVVTTGSDDGDRENEPPRPLTLEVDLPSGWSEVTRPTVVDCTTQLRPQTVYRDVALGDLGYCPPQQPISVTGPSLLLGQLPADVAEMIRAVGTPVETGGVPGWATSYDAEFSYVVWLPAGSPDDLAYAAVAPRTENGVSAYEDKVGGGSPLLPAELVDLVATVRTEGDLPGDAVLPRDVSAVDLRQSGVNSAPAPGARVLGPGSVDTVLDELRAGPGGGACGPIESVRTMHLQDARSHRWVRVDVLEDAAGCRSIVSERGGQRRIGGDPVALATALDEPQHVDVEPTDERRVAHGLDVAVPAGWQVVAAATVDPCTLPGPSVVVADELVPSCAADPLMRPTHPYLWVTGTRIEDRVRFEPLGPTATRNDVGWRETTIDADGTDLTGQLGRPARGAGRLLLVTTETGTADELRDDVRVEASS